jgi:hypothetical protein
VNSIASEAQSAADQDNIKGVFDSIKRLTNAFQVSTVHVKTKDGKCITTSEGQLQKWREFFKEILDSDCPPYEEEEVTRSVPLLQISIRTPSKRVSMKNGKAARSDIIPAEILKLDSSKLLICSVPCPKKFGRRKHFRRSGKKE